jgi:hypothetical protein
MRAFVDARSGFLSDTDATQVVDFNRAFRLSGSANGWQVSITGFYLGFLGVQPLGSLNPKASVAVFGSVDSLDVNATPIHILDSVTLDSSGMTGTSSGITMADVPDGNYEFTGSLSAGGSVLHSLGFGQAFSDFFSLPPGFGLSLTLNAVPRAAALPPPPPLIPPQPVPPDRILRICRHPRGGSRVFEHLAPGQRVCHAGVPEAGQNHRTYPLRV